MPDNYQEKTWEKLQKAVVAIQTSKSIEYSLEELYQAVENMCSHKMDSQLYTKLTALTESHVKLNIKTFFADTNDKLVSKYCNCRQNGIFHKQFFYAYLQVYLKKMDECWQSHCQQMIMIRSIFLYLDRTYVLQNPTVHSIWYAYKPI